MIELVTVRERICAQIERNMKRLVDSQNNNVFIEVNRAPLVIANYIQSGNCLGIVDLGDLNVDYLVGYTSPTTRLAFEFGIVLEEGENATSKLNSVLGMIIKKVSLDLNTIEDNTNEELTLDVKYVSYEPDVSDFADKVVSGVVIIDFQYRYKSGYPEILM